MQVDDADAGLPTSQAAAVNPSDPTSAISMTVPGQELTYAVLRCRGPAGAGATVGPAVPTTRAF